MRNERIGRWRGEEEDACHVSMSWADRWAESEDKGEYRFSSLVRFKKKEKIYALFYFAGKRFFFYIYDAITWEK